MAVHTIAIELADGAEAALDVFRQPRQSVDQYLASLVCEMLRSRLLTLDREPATAAISPADIRVVPLTGGA